MPSAGSGRRGGRPRSFASGPGWRAAPTCARRRFTSTFSRMPRPADGFGRFCRGHGGSGVRAVPGSTGEADIPARTRWLSRLAWSARRVQGKTLSVLRLVKSAFTFQGGVDYLLWKLERHSGVRVEATERERRHPLIYGWGLAWRLYRRGAFR